MVKSLKRAPRARPYSEELRADLLKHFEAGKGYISQEGKEEISKKYGLPHQRIAGWANDRRRRRGVYDDVKFWKMFWKHVSDNPNQPPTQEIEDEFERVFTKMAQIEGWMDQAKIETGTVEEK